MRETPSGRNGRVPVRSWKGGFWSLCMVELQWNVGFLNCRYVVWYFRRTAALFLVLRMSARMACSHNFSSISRVILDLIENYSFEVINV